MKTRLHEKSRTTYSIFWQTVQELSNTVVVVLFELMSSPDNAVLKSERFVRDKEGEDLLDLHRRISGVFQRRLDVVGIGEI